MVCLAERVRRNDLVSLRNPVRNEEHRLFLAFLINLPNRDAIFRAVQREHPACDPAEKIATWLEELANPTETEHTGRRSSARLAFDFDDLSLMVLRRLLQGQTGGELVDSVVSECEAQGVEADPKQIKMAAQVIPNVAFVKQLFTE